MSTDLQDLVVIGAGPTGLALAAEFTRLGRSALILDRLAEGLNTSRAAVVHARTLEVLNPLGVTSALIGEGVKAARFEMHEGDEVLASINFSHLETPYPYLLLISQHRTEAILNQRLQSLGGTVSRPCELMSLTEHADSVEVTYQCGQQTHTVHTRYLAACDGGKSLIREQAGIPFEGGEYQESFVLGDVTMDWPLAPNVGYLFFAPRGLLLVVPLPGDRFRIVATLADAPPLPSIHDLQAILDERGPRTRTAHITGLAWSSRFHIHHRLAARFRQGRILLAGDAAHVHSPAGGQGMNTGIQDAVDLAGTLHRALADPTQAEPLLEEWQARRRRIAKSVVDFTDRTTRLGSTTNPLLRSLRNTALELGGHLPFVQNAMARKIAELDNR